MLGPSPKLKPEGKGLDRSRTLVSTSTTTTNFSASTTYNKYYIIYNCEQNAPKPDIITMAFHTAIILTIIV
jgi:hypothetical protein